MLFFLYGANTTALRAKVDEIRQQFITKYGDVDVEVVDAAETETWAGVQERIRTLPFFGQRRLLILKDFLSTKRKDLLDGFTEAVGAVPDHVVLVVHETVQPKETALVKRLKKEKYAKEFAAPSPYELQKHIERFFASSRKRIAPSAAAFLAQELAGDPERLRNELDKVLTYAAESDDPITAEDIHLLVRPKVAANVFSLVDAIGAKNADAAIKELERLDAAGEPTLRILAMVIYQLRNLLLVKDALQHGMPTSAFPKRLKLHPFVAQKSVRQAQNFSLDELKALFSRLRDIDVGLKTGKLVEENVLLSFVLESAIDGQIEKGPRRT